ncbi:MAG: VOC family protein [Methyloceanibacter sp.]
MVRAANMNSAVETVLSNPRLHHVGIVTASAQRALEHMSKLGLQEDFRGYVEKWDVLCIFARPNGGSPIEFVVPFSGPLLEFNRGLGGIHHVALTVPDLRAAMTQLAARGVKMLEEEPVKGAGPFLCNFLHPLYTRAFAVELVEEL